MEQQQQVELGRSLAYTPTWSIATVTTILVALGYLAQWLIHIFGNVRRAKDHPSPFLVLCFFPIVSEVSFGLLL